MKMPKKPYILPLCLLLATAGTCNADDKASAFPIEQVIQFVDKPARPFASLSPFKLQTCYRLMWLRHRAEYVYQEEHAIAWLQCMRDKNRNMYARLCAAYYLLDQHEEARTFVEEQLQSKNLRHRHNAAEVVKIHVGRDPKKEWGVGILIQLLADGSIDGSDLGSSPPGEYPQSDRDDILMTPIDDICWSLGHMKEQKAVPALISVLERRPWTSGAVFALGEIGDKRAIPILMKRLTDESRHDDREITALGKLKHREAVPILITRLMNPSTTLPDSGVMKTERLLEALLDIGDKRAIEPIGAYLKGENPKISKAIARRVYVQLTSDAPAAALLELLDKETYKPEQRDIIHDLVKYPDSRVVMKLAAIAQTSNSAYMRRESIFALRAIGNRDALLALAALLDATFPKDLDAKWGWKLAPDFEVYFPETIEKCLKQCTKQDFGKDKTKWDDWIMKHVQPTNALNKE